MYHRFSWSRVPRLYSDPPNFRIINRKCVLASPLACRIFGKELIEKVVTPYEIEFSCGSNGLRLCFGAVVVAVMLAINGSTLIHLMLPIYQRFKCHVV